MRILLADDERDVVVAIKGYLQRKGHEVDVAFDGLKAKRLIDENSYDLVFLDHNMPGLTGLEIIKHIKSRSLGVKTVMLTAYPAIDEFFAKTLGVDEYLDKSSGLDGIGALVDKYIQEKESRE